MNTKRIYNEKGQSLVVVAILMIVFIGLLALVLDGGFGYYQRRIAQNAADAGALAAASAICRGADPNQAANTAANANDAILESLSIIGEREVEVVTRIEFNTFFGSIYIPLVPGENNMTARATAAAGCYAPGRGVGVIPVAWSCQQPLQGEYSESDDCVIQYQIGDQCTWGEDPMYIIIDNKNECDPDDPDPKPNCQNVTPITCQYPLNSGEPVGAVDCDIDNNNINDVSLFDRSSMSWLDLDGSGGADGGKGGAADLKAWIAGEFVEVYPHYWVPRKAGVDGSVYDTVYDKVLDQYVTIPVYDSICPEGVPENFEGGHCNLQIHTEDTIIGDKSVDYYHIISFSLFHPTCVDSASHKCELTDQARPHLNTMLEELDWSNGAITSQLS